ncbi:MAG: hypothetical protein IKK50_01350 [Ruminiclostridium sp.]|nr:hypothetical protein [Ruminiclostridium sp.]
MEHPSRTQPIPGSVTPGLEGAPSTITHENRMKSVIPLSQPQADIREEGSPSKP